MQELLDLFHRNWKQLEKQVFLLSITIFAKTLDVYCIFITYTIFGHLSHFDKFSGHPRVIFADARSSLKFCVSFIARFIVNIQSVPWSILDL